MFENERHFDRQVLYKKERAKSTYYYKSDYEIKKETCCDATVQKPRVQELIKINSGVIKQRLLPLHERSSAKPIVRSVWVTVGIGPCPARYIQNFQVA
jgi:hypothetical protein